MVYKERVGKRIDEVLLVAFGVVCRATVIAFRYAFSRSYLAAHLSDSSSYGFCCLARQCKLAVASAHTWSPDRDRQAHGSPRGPSFAPSGGRLVPSTAQ